MGGRQLTPSLSVPFEFINFLGDSKATPRKIWRGGAPKSALAAHCASCSLPRALPAGSPLPHFQGTRVKVTTFLPEWGSVCLGRPQRRAVSGCCPQRLGRS